MLQRNYRFWLVLMSFALSIFVFWGYQWEDRLYKSRQLCRAVLSGDIDVVRNLLNQGINQNYEEFVNNVCTDRYPFGIGKARGAGETFEPLLAFAVWPKDNIVKQEIIVSLLLHAGANIDGVNREIPLMRARAPRTIHFLAVNGANLDCRDAEGETALIVAAKFQDLPSIRALVTSGACVNVKDQFGFTPLNATGWLPTTSAENRKSCRDYLISHGAE